MSGGMQIWPISEVRERVTDDPNIKEVKVVAGHTNKTSGIVVMNIHRNESNTWNNKLLDKLEQHRGNYTAFLMPSKEVLWLEGQPQSQQQEFNYLYPFQTQEQSNQLQQYNNTDVRQLINELMEAKQKNAELQEEVNDLKEELKQFETASGKFEHALGNVFMNVIVPMFSGQPQQSVQQPSNNNKPMQGEQEETDFTKLPLQDKGDGGVQDAFNIIYHAFGDELVVKIAQRLQREPQLVNTLRAFIG